MAVKKTEYVKNKKTGKLEGSVSLGGKEAPGKIKLCKDCHLEVKRNHKATCVARLSKIVARDQDVSLAEFASGQSSASKAREAKKSDVWVGNIQAQANKIKAIVDAPVVTAEDRMAFAVEAINRVKALSPAAKIAHSNDLELAIANPARRASFEASYGEIDWSK